MNLSRRDFIKRTAVASLFTMAACSKNEEPSRATVKDLMADKSVSWEKNTL